MRPLAATVLVSVTMIGSIAAAQDNMLRYLDLTTPDMTHAEMSRADIDALISEAGGRPLDLSGKRLSGLNLSGANLSGANLRLSRLNRTDLSSADLSGATLDQAWLLKANMRGAKLVGASFFGAQVREADLSGADLTRAKLIGTLAGQSSGEQPLSAYAPART